MHTNTHTFIHSHTRSTRTSETARRKPETRSYLWLGGSPTSAEARQLASAAKACSSFAEIARAAVGRAATASETRPKKHGTIARSASL